MTSSWASLGFGSWKSPAPTVLGASNNLHLLTNRRTSMSFWTMENRFPIPRQHCKVQVHLTYSLSEPVLSQMPDRARGAVELHPHVGSHKR